MRDKSWGAEAIWFNGRHRLRVGACGLCIAAAARKVKNLSDLSCTAGQIPEFDGTNWTCATDVDTDTLASLICSAGQIPKFDGTKWTCAADNTGTDTLGALGCTEGQVTIFKQGQWTCADSKESPPRFVDNGNGTVTDNQTGLMWEKKLPDDGSQGGNCTNGTQTNRSIHCVNNTYQWSTNLADPNGSLFTDFLARINTTLALHHLTGSTSLTFVSLVTATGERLTSRTFRPSCWRHSHAGPASVSMRSSVPGSRL